MRRINLLAACVACAVVAFSGISDAFVAPAATTATINVEVQDTTGNPAASVMVKLMISAITAGGSGAAPTKSSVGHDARGLAAGPVKMFKQAKTDKTGKVVFEKIPKNNYSVRAGDNTVGVAAQPLEVDDFKAFDVKLKLEK